MNRDQNLLFGVLAVQLRKITPTQLVDVAGAWATDPSRDLPERLVELGLLSAADKDLVAEICHRAVEDFDGDASKTLLSFGGEDVVHQTFRGSIIMEEDGGVSRIEDLSSSPVSSDPDSVPAVQETPGRYTNPIEHAKGGMGQILIVHDEHLKRDVALKELLPSLSGSSERALPSARSASHSHLWPGFFKKPE